MASGQLPALLRPVLPPPLSVTGAGLGGSGSRRDEETARLLPAAVPAGRSALRAQQSAPSKAVRPGPRVGTGTWSGPEATAPAGLSSANPQPTTPGFQELQVFPGFLPTLVSFLAETHFVRKSAPQPGPRPSGSVPQGCVLQGPFAWTLPGVWPCDLQRKECLGHFPCCAWLSHSPQFLLQCPFHV